MEDFLHGNIPLNAKAPCTLKAITQGCYTCQIQISISWKLGPKRVPIEQVIPCVLFAEKKIQTVTCRSLHYNYCHKRLIHNTFPKKLNITICSLFLDNESIGEPADSLSLHSAQRCRTPSLYILWNTQNYWDMQVLIWGRKRWSVNSKLLLQH